MSTNINSTEQIVEINAGDQITNVNIVSQSTTQVISGEQVVTVDVNAGTIPAAWGSITGTLSNQTDLQNALNAKQNNITLTTTGSTGVATLVGSTLNIPNYVSSTKQSQWDSAYNDKINSAEVSGTTTKTLTLTQQDGGIIQASWSDFDTAPVTSVFGRTGDVVAAEGDYNINQLGDVTITSATNGQVLKYNGTAWVNAADASGLTSVGLAMPSAFTVSGSPLISNGTITVTGAGTTSQYVRGDGSLATFPTTSNEAKTLIREVYNKTGATLTKGTVVYIDGGQGNLPTVTKAIAIGDPTSAQTFGIVQSDITNMNNGFVVIAGGIDNIDTQAYTEGTALYLSPTTAGAFTSTKPYAPNHLVYLGVVVRSHPTQGVIEVKIQNGYELDELHNVSARFPTNKDGLFYNSTSNVWENKSIAGVLGYTPVPQSRIITINGTAQDLSADRTYNVGTVTSIAASGGTGISISGSPVTGSGTISIVNTAPDQTVTITPSGLATVSGTYPNFTVGVSDAYAGSVTSVNASVPTGFEVSGVPITTAGTIDIKFASGYSLPTTAKQTQWDDAYTKRVNSLTVTGNSGSSTLVSNVLNVPTYTLSGLGGEPAITAGTSLQYWRGDKTFQTLNTGVVPESGNIYFTEPRVRATVLSGLNITGGSISASDSVLDAFGKVQNQINGLIGGSIFQSTWNASTNNPTLTSSVGTKGYYYIVSVAGTTNLNGITDWQIGDWAIFDGTVWRKVDNTDAVVSVNGFTGTVSLGISNLADVSASSPTDTQLLRFNGTTSKWYNWAPTYISGNQTITLSGDVTGSGTTAITTSIGTGKVTNAMLAGSINYGKMDAATVPTWNQDTTGNAATADKWKTARTLTIGATGKSIDGSGNVSWSLAEIGAQAALTNPITGDGTEVVGNIAIFSGNTSINGYASLFWDNTNGYFGVNTNGTPNTPLNVKGAHVGGYGLVSFVSSDNMLLAIDSTSTTVQDVRIRYKYQGVDKWLVGMSNDNDYTIDAAGTIRSRLTSAGNLTIGGSFTASIAALGSASDRFVVSNSGTLNYRTAAQVLSDIGALSTSVAASTYLPLAGGTLTGLLTSTISSGNNIVLNKATGPSIKFNKTNATAQSWEISTDPNFRIANSTLSTDAVVFNATSNNANFSGYVGVNCNPSYLVHTFKTGDLDTMQILAETDVSSVVSYVGISPHILKYYRNVATSVDLQIQTSVTSDAPGGDIVFMPNSPSANHTPLEQVRFKRSGTVLFGAYTTNGILKVSGGTGTVALAVAGTDYVAPSALSSYVLKAGDTMTGALGIGIAPTNAILRLKADWVGGYGTVVIQGSTTDQTGIALFDAASTRKGVFAFDGTTIYLESENTGIPIQIRTAAVTRLSIAGTGAATFTSSVTNTSGMLLNVGATGTNANMTYTTFSNGVYSALNSSTPSEGVGMWSDNQGNAMVGALYNNNASSINLVLRASSSTSGFIGLKIAGTGASTFVSSVTAGGEIKAYYANAKLSVTDGTNGMTLGQWDGSYNRIEAAGRAIFMTAYSNSIYFGISGSIGMTFDTASNLGIGTQSPSCRLNTFLSNDLDTIQIMASTDVSSVVSYTGLGANNITFRREIATGVDFTIKTLVPTASSGGNMVFAIQNTSTNYTATEAMRITKAGRVSIGNDASPNGVLHVKGAHVGGYGIVNIISSDNCLIAMDTTAATYDVRLRLKYNGADKWLAGMSNDDSYKLESALGVKFTLTQAGALTLSSSISAASLSISGNTTFGDGVGNSTATVQSTAFANLIIKSTGDATNNAQLQLISGGQTNPYYMYMDGTRNLIFKDNTTEKLQLTANGQISYNPLSPKVTAVTNINGSSTQTPTLNTSDTYVYVGTSTTAYTLTIANPTGTPTQGQKMIIRLKDNGTQVMSLSFGTQFRASTDLTLPTSTTAGKTLYLGFIYNSTDTKWDLLAKIDNF